MPDEPTLVVNEFDDDSFDDGDEVDPAFYANGGIIFSEDELGALGDLKGKRVLHLTFGCTEEGLSLVNMGAIVTEAGDDGGSAALAEAAGLTIEFVEETPARLSAEFCDTRTFDLVYSSWGAMDWIASFESWAEGVAALLPPGGKLVIYDEHPFSYVFEAGENGELVAATSYFGGLGDDSGGESDEEGDEEDETPGVADVPEELDVPTEDNVETDEVGWTLGDLIGALGSNGLGVVDLQEFETSERYETALDRLAVEADETFIEDGDEDEEGLGPAVDEAELAKVPAALLLVAVKLA